MPLSKEKQAEWMREYRKRRKSVIPKSSTVIPKLVADETSTVIPKCEIPKLPWYAGASDHFGVVRNRRYAKEFFANLG